MATLTVRNLDDRIKARLRLRAAAHARSMEAEVRDILNQVLSQTEEVKSGLGSRLHKQMLGHGGGVEWQSVRRHAPREPMAFDGHGDVDDVI